jgi:crotonobetainyl-CoA:carnitine CoA-transferase CaiB-like acyl-CoA transferase
VFERRAVREVDVSARGTIKVLGTPIKMSEHEEPAMTAPPAIGADTDTVLQRFLGLSVDEIDGLRAAAVI